MLCDLLLTVVGRHSPSLLMLLCAYWISGNGGVSSLFCAPPIEYRWVGSNYPIAPCALGGAVLGYIWGRAARLGCASSYLFLSLDCASAWFGVAVSAPRVVLRRWFSELPPFTLPVGSYSGRRSGVGCVRPRSRA